MRVLMANKFYFLKGGAERYTLELSKLLEKHGHEVVPFAMRNRRNRNSEFRKFFVSPVETENPGFWQGLRTAGRMTYSLEARFKFSKLVNRTKPDILHVQNIYHQISPSILRTAEKQGLPAVMTMHDYHLISPNYSMFENGRVVEPSKKHPYWTTVRRRSVRGSLSASLIAGFKSWLHDELGLYDHIYRFIAPSAFMKDICVQHGMDEERIEVIPHFIDLEGKEPNYRSEDRVVYVGRLSREKGVAVLIRAMKRLPKAKCVIIGSGPDRKRLRSIARRKRIRNILFKGALYGRKLEAEIAKARVVVIPSLSYEVFGLAALEAYAAGKPVVASRIGGLPEVVRYGQTGYLFKPGDSRDLAKKLSELVRKPERAARMGRTGRKLAEIEYTPEEHYQRIKKLYDRAVNQ